jgi:hypothetical protein
LLRKKRRNVANHQRKRNRNLPARISEEKRSGPAHVRARKEETSCSPIGPANPAPGQPGRTLGASPSFAVAVICGYLAAASSCRASRLCRCGHSARRTTRSVEPRLLLGARVLPLQGVRARRHAAALIILRSRCCCSTSTTTP